jgi:putative ATPase
VGPNGSLTQQIAKGIIPSSFYGDRREQEKNFAQIIAQESNALLYFKRY